MYKKHKILMICGCLIGFGCILSLTGFLLGGRVSGMSFDSDGFHVYSPDNPSGAHSNSTFEENNITLDQFDSISINTQYMEVHVQESDHYGIASGLYTPHSNLSYSIANGVLAIEVKVNPPTSRTGINWISLDLTEWIEDSEYITVYVPKETNLDTVTIHNSTGDTYLDGITARTLSQKGEFGEIEIQDTVVTDTLHIEMDTGNVEINSLSADTLSITTQFGAIDAENLNLQSVQINAATGDCRLQAISLENAEITSEFGNVDLQLNDSVSDYSYQLSTSFGEITVDDEDYGSNYVQNQPSSQSITINGNTSDINIYN